MKIMFWFIHHVYNFFIDALFPVSPEEEVVLRMSPDEARAKLKPSPITPFPEMRAVLAYKDRLVRSLVLSIKDKAEKRALDIAGHILWQEVKHITTSNNYETAVLIPIPSTKKNLKMRGYNQCELIMRQILKQHDRELVRNTAPTYTDSNTPKIEIVLDLLIRARDSGKQALKSRKNRITDTHDIFAINKKTIEKYRHLFQNTKSTVCVFIIDDVITTGSTMKSAIETLRQELVADKIFGLALAH